MCVATCLSFFFSHYYVGHFFKSSDIKFIMLSTRCFADIMPCVCFYLQLHTRYYFTPLLLTPCRYLHWLHFVCSQCCFKGQIHRHLQHHCRNLYVFIDIVFFIIFECFYRLSSFYFMVIISAFFGHADHPIKFFVVSCFHQLLYFCSLDQQSHKSSTSSDQF